MTRNEALEKLAIPSYDDEDVKNDFQFVATKLGISVEELQHYMHAENKSYKDYKSQRTLYFIGAKIMKYLGLERAGKR